MAQKNSIRKFVQPKTTQTSKKSSNSGKPTARPIEEILEDKLLKNFPNANINFTHIMKKSGIEDDYTRWAVYWQDGPTEAEVQTVIASNISTPTPVFGETSLKTCVRFDVKRFSTDQLPRQIIDRTGSQKDRIAKITESLTQAFGICDFIVKPVQTNEKTDDTVYIAWQNGPTKQMVWKHVYEYGNPYTQKIILVRTYSETTLNRQALAIFMEASIQNVILDDPYTIAVQELEDLTIDSEGNVKGD